MQNMIRVVVILFLALVANVSGAAGLSDAFLQSSAGMRAQSERMKVIAQNIANSESTGSTPGAEPYRRKIISFNNEYDKNLGTDVIKVKKIERDRKSEFGKKFDPGHPAANEYGYVLLPNVKKSVEMLDMKEAERNYEANLGAIETTKRMFSSTLDLLR